MVYQGLVGTIILHNGRVDMDPEVSFSWALPGLTSLISRHLMMFMPLMGSLLYSWAVTICEDEVRHLAEKGMFYG